VTVLTLYSRPGCHLCDDARRMIARLLDEGHGFELREVDIDSDDRLLRTMLERIPVIEIDGAVVSELIPDEVALRTRLASVEA
jgi:glutaredoxin